jgi:general secretion pathway protein G
MTASVRRIAWRSASTERGFTFIELLIVSTILIILASAVMPLAKVTNQRQKEAELRRALREMRTAIDKFKDAADAGQVSAFDLRPGSENYPPDLDTLVEGVGVVGDASGRKLKFLRRIPIDPFTNSTEWGLRAYQDRPDAMAWGGQNVYDVYTKAGGTALDGTKYKDW